MEGETLPRFDSKSRMFGNVKYPQEHRIPEYTQKAAFFYLEIVTMCASLQYYTVLVYASVLVGVVHFRLFPIFRAHLRCQVYLLDTIYCVHTPHCTYMQCACLLPRPPAYLRPCVRPCPCAPARARAPACVCACVRARVRARACVRACACAALASVVRAYIVASPAVLPRAELAANFFEIVFGQLISVQLSSA